jgi:putative membrane protein
VSSPSEPGRGRSGPALGDTTWHRLHPLSPFVRLGGVLAVIGFVLVDRLAEHQSGVDTVSDAGVFGLSVVAGVIRWIVTRWRVEGGALLIDTGLLRRQSLRLPLAQLQAVDIVQPAFARILGLAELRLRMAGSVSTAGRLAYLPTAEAEALRGQLLAVAHGLAADAPPPPGQVLLSVPPGRLLASLMLAGPGLFFAGWLLLVVLVAAFAHASVRTSVGGSVIPFLIVAAATTWRRLNAGYGLTLSAAPDGLRMRSGLLSQASETIPRGRVQAARVVQPLLWRPLRWSRLELEVAGSSMSEQQGARNQRRSLRTVLPVGTDAEAAWLLQLLFPGAPQPLSPPPRRARWKSPLAYHWLGWGADEHYAVTSGGRLRRVVYHVPLAKVQSIRFVQGPLQRRLALASVHLDTPGRRGTHAVLRDRDVAETALLQEDLPARCRAARALDRPVAGWRL